MKTTTRRIAYLATYLVFIVVFCVMLRRNYDVVDLLSWRNSCYFAAIVSLFWLVQICLGVTNTIAFNAIADDNVSAVDGMRMGIINSLGNFLPLSAGLVAKGIYLKRRYRIEYSHYSVISIFVFAVLVSANGLTGVGALTWMSATSLVIWSGFACMALAGTIVLARPEIVPQISRRHNPLRLTEICRKFRKVVVKLYAVQLIIVLSAALRMYLGFQIVAHSIPFSACVLLAAANILTRLVTLTPGAVGVREAIVAGVAHFSGVDVPTSVLVVGLDRLGQLVGVFGISAVFHLSFGITVRDMSGDDSAENSDSCPDESTSETTSSA